VLVNNAGIGVFKSVADLTIDDWKQTIETNLSGAFYCSRAALHRMRSRRSGYLVNISSLAGKNLFAGGAAYNASNCGLHGFSDAMILDHRSDGIPVRYVLPGMVGYGVWQLLASHLLRIGRRGFLAGVAWLFGTMEHTE